MQMSQRRDDFGELDFGCERITSVRHLTMDQCGIDIDIGINGSITVFDCPAGRLSTSLDHGSQWPGTGRQHSAVATDFKKDILM
jgi:hypothetical protein